MNKPLMVFFEVKDFEVDYINQAFSTSANVVLCEDQLCSDNVAQYADAEIIATFINSECSSQVLEKFKNLKHITTRSTGFDHIDLDFCKNHNISVSNVPNYGQNTVAEHAMALLLALAKKIPQSIERVRSGSFSPDGLTGFDLKGKIVGVIGTGHIGRNFIKMANGFGMNVIAYDPKADLACENELGFTYVELKYLFSKSDVISLHLPLLESTKHLVNNDAISLMKKGVVIINTSRGGLIDTNALYEGLVSAKIGGAGLDVLEEENIFGGKEDNDLEAKNHSMSYMDTVIVTPHNAFNTTEALVRIIETSIENIKGFINDQKVNIVSK